MGGTAHGLLRLTGERSDLSRVLDVIGVGMLIPMPPLWLCDMALIAADRFRFPELAIVNPTVQLWETALFSIGLRTVLGVPWRRARPAGSLPAWSTSSEPPGSCGEGRRGDHSPATRPGYLPCGKPPEGQRARE